VCGDFSSFGDENLWRLLVGIESGMCGTNFHQILGISINYY